MKNVPRIEKMPILGLICSRQSAVTGSMSSSRCSQHRAGGHSLPGKGGLGPLGAPRFHLCLLSLLLIGSLAQCNAAHRPKNVNVALQAKWTSTPLLLEAGELLAKNRDDLYWTFVEQWNTREFSDSMSDRDCFERILAIGSSLLNGPTEPIFHLSLLLRSASPKLVLYRQLAQESLFRYQMLKQGSYSNEGITPGASLTMDIQSKDLDRWSISRNPSAAEGRCCWVDVGTYFFVEVSELSTWLKTLEQKAEDLEEIELFDFDHIYPGSASTNIVAILYGAVGTPCFWKFHSVLAEASKQGNIRYAFRPVLPTGCEEAANKCALVGFGTVLHLGGYGVELALKNMEYKAIDDSDVKKGDTLDESRTDDLSQEVKGFIFSKLLERKPELTGELMTFRDHLFSAGLSDTMNVWELKDLGYQTAQRIIHAAEPLQLMQEINQNFPNLVSSLSRMKLNQTMKEEIVANQRMIPPGKSLFALNGALIDIDSLDLYSLIDLVGGELSLADAIFKMKVPSRFARSLMQIPDPAEKSSIRVDFRSDHVHYLNNLEEDALYRRWRSNVNELLMPVFPGQLRYIKKNLYHAVYVIDPATPAGLKVIDTVMHYYDNNVPMRFGLILLSSKMVKSMIDHGGVLPSVGTSNEDEEDLSSLIVRLFFYIKDNYGITTAFQFLNSINEAQGGDIDGQEDEPVEVSYVEEAFFETVKARAKTPAEEILQKLEKGIDYKEEVLKSTEFVYKLGFSQMHPCLLMNGLVYGPSQVQSGALAAMNEELPRIQEGVYYGQINSKTDVLDKFLKENGHARYNPHIIVTNKEEHRYISLTEAVTGQESVLAGLHFLHSPGTEDDIKPITHLVVVDLSDREGFQLLQQAVRYLMNGSKKGRLGILFNILDVSSSVKPTHLLLYRVIKASMNSSLRRKILPFLQSLLSWSETHSLIVAEQSQSDTESLVESLMNLADEVGIKLGALRNELTDPSVTDLYVEQMSKEVVFLSTQLGLKPGSNAVVTNGKIFVQKKGEYFFAEDFLLLESVEYEQRVKPVAEIVEKVEWEVMEPDELTSEFISTVIMAISSAMAVRSRSSGTARFDLLQSEFSAIVRQADNATIHVDAVVDPLSSTGQKLSPLLLLLQHWFQPSMRIVLNPMNSLADLPLKNFYRYVVPPKDNFTPDGELMAGLVAVFSNMPPTRTLTMNLDVPEPWLVEPVRAIHDLDNIVLEKIGDVRTMYAGFELEALVLTGHCFEKNNDPPRGLQLLLGTKIQSHMVDTIVMANLGYWQLKAAPGVWTLSLAPGRSSNLYTLHGPEEGTENGPLSKKVFIKDLRGELIRLEVVKRKGLEDQKVLGSDDETDDEYFGFSTKKGKKSWNKNLLKWASGLLGSSKQAQESNDQGQLHGRIIERRGEAINIFSIASGHLYERFLKIMMLSVLRNTRRPVKFWFIKNYLSPQFKDFIPQMAMEYGFDYDLVTYKWPTWLQKQSEKQRIIWAYKILFLDVIFPLSLKKVIFVDADQIVRTDMGELYDMDLKGKPLAYTPFCDNNKEMDGYRFWNQGFWKDHLRGKPYHISALYVVDLVKFRQTAAGDTLRVFYETLSKDPGSLSNLDQDLPNYAQHTVPIFSLPQEWLWCESWCGNATKSKAKTIDLCNNPMTKEPKLEGARRIVAEWPSLDEEARRLTAKILGEDADTSPEELENEELPSSNTDSDAETAAEL